jgi:hypothetical protein
VATLFIFSIGLHEGTIQSPDELTKVNALKPKA